MRTYVRGFVFATLLLLSPSISSAASLYIDPDTGTYGPGDTFIAAVRLNNDGECLNAAHVVLQYSKDSLRAVDFGKGGSILTLWVGEPQIDTNTGTVVFDGGVPGGYCGRIQGDPALSNILGKVVFTVVGAKTPTASVHVSADSMVYLNDGLGTKVKPDTHDATITLSPTSVGTKNPWLAEVGADTIPPEAFDIQVESTRGVFGGKYYIVFSTVDKQSGLDHFETFERGAWKKVTSPYELRDQSLTGDIQVKAIDKAGNIRLGTYTPGNAPPLQAPPYNQYITIFIVLGLLIFAGLAKLYLDRKPKSDVIDLRT